VIAEQFGTLEALHPGRIDLGLGRAPGTDQLTVHALRRDPAGADTFPQDVVELQRYLAEAQPNQLVQATPGAGSRVPLWILGSSLFGAQLAAALGLPYAFASHFAPARLEPAVAAYRREFKPSEQLAEPYVIVGANVIAADDADDAQKQFETVRRVRVRGMISRGPNPPNYTDAEIDAFLSTPNGRQIANMMKYTAVGTASEVRDFLEGFASSTGAAELIVAHPSQRIADRLRSVELTAGAVLGADA
jgi:luciferase family oxidoreductase group 1